MHGNAVRNIPVDGNEPAIEPRLASLADTAFALGKITEREVYRRIADGDLEAVWLGRRRVVLVASIDAYVERLREQARERSVAA